MVPLLYQGLLSICVFLADPLGDDIIDFPVRHYQLGTGARCATQLSVREFYENRVNVEKSPLPHAHVITSLVPEKADKSAPARAPASAAASAAPAAASPVAFPATAPPPASPPTTEVPLWSPSDAPSLAATLGGAAAAKVMDKLSQRFESLTQSICTLADMMKASQLQCQATRDHTNVEFPRKEWTSCGSLERKSDNSSV